MKTVISVCITTMAVIVTTILLFVLSAGGLVIWISLVELMNFTWGSTFHSMTQIELNDMIDSIMKYWLRIATIIYIPAIVYFRIKHTDEF